MKRKLFFVAIFMCLLPMVSMAQLAMGKWRTHFAYNSVMQIAQSKNKIYAVSEGALYSVDKLDENIEFYSKVSGLNGTNISRIEYDTENEQLLIIYTNGNIDLLGNGGVTNIPDLMNKQMSASKVANQIMFYQDKAYLACNFGVVVLNLKKKEIADTYYIGANASSVKVIGTAVVNGSIYAMTPTTIYKASASETQLVNYEFWSTVGGLPGSGDFQSVGAFAGNLFVLRGGKLYKQDELGTWTAFLPGINVSYFNIANNKMLVNDGSSTIFIVDETLNYKTVTGIGVVPDAEYDSANDTYWFAANSLGVISYKQTGTETPVVNYYKPAGPALNSPWKMVFSGKKLFIVPGGRFAIFYNTPGYVMMFENGSWTNVGYQTIEPKTGTICRDIVSVAVDAKDNKHFFAASYSSGLYEFRNNEFYKYHNFTNSTISNLYNSYQYQMLDGTTYDENGNLWLLNSYAGKSIKVHLSDSTWTELDYPGLRNFPTLQDILISNQNQNQKWITSVREKTGVFVMDDNGTIKDQSDDKSIFYASFPYEETDNNNQTTRMFVSPVYIFSIAQDKNGAVWVGTDQGPVVFNNLSKVFDADYACTRIKIPRNDNTGLADYLLANERIKAIAIDGANRKWLGTETSGVYLMSENGQQTIQHFTTANSQLLSNTIMSIAINPVTGEVYFGTDKGLVSYQSDAAESSTTFSNVYAYPNPVREGYTGLITITGLIENTQVKITDLNGNLVCETVSNGSLATWDGKDKHGRKVNTGIYLAICVSSDGLQNVTTKILVIN